MKCSDCKHFHRIVDGICQRSGKKRQGRHDKCFEPKELDGVPRSSQPQTTASARKRKEIKLRPALIPDLFTFSYIPDWYGQLSNLADMAQPEPWSFKNPAVLPKNPDTPILERYIHFVFKKQIIDYNSEPEQIDADTYFYIRNEVACFNTGLYTKNYRDIYACFTRNKRVGSMQDWFFMGFADNASSVMRCVQPLPQKPRFLKPQCGVNYYPTWDIRVNVAHILGDSRNVERLPEEMQQAKNLPLMLEVGVELARRKAAFEPGIVVQQGYQGEIQFLLPIYLLDMEHPDLAMTITPMEGYYLGHTCLTLEMAYMNARLIGRPIAPWLRDLVV